MALLDEAGEGFAAARLQGAIDTVSLDAAVHGVEGHSEEQSPSARAARQQAAPVRAIGGVLAGAAASLARRKPMSVAEFARFLATYASVTRETSEEEGQIIESWSSILNDVADEVRRSQHSCHSCAGLPDVIEKVRPMRMPHQPVNVNPPER